MKTYVRIELKSERNEKYKRVQVLCKNDGDSLGIMYMTPVNRSYYIESKIVKCDLREIVILDVKKYSKTGYVNIKILDPVTREVRADTFTKFIKVDKSLNPHLITRINRFCGYELLKTH